MKLFFQISVLLLASAAWSQSIVVTGTVTDSSGHPYAGGSGSVRLVPQNVQFLVNGTNPVTSPIPISGLDSFGHFSIQLTNTSIIQPQTSNPQWQFTFTNAPCPNQPIPASFAMTPLSLTTSQDISTTIQAQAAPSLCTGGNGTVNPGTQYQIAYYATTGSAVSGDPNITDTGSLITLANAGGGTGLGALTLGNSSTGGNSGAIDLSDGSGNALIFGAFGGSRPWAINLSNANITAAFINTTGAAAFVFGSPLSIGVNPTPGTTSPSISNGFTISSSTTALVGTLTLPGLSGTTCLEQVNGVVTDSGSPCGGGGGVTGSGTTGTIPIWTSSTALGNSNLTASGSTLSSTYSTLSFPNSGTHALTSNGQLNLTTSNSATPGPIQLTAGNSTSSGVAGAGASITGGNGNGIGQGGQVTISGGTGGTGNTGNGGPIVIQSGAADNGANVSVKTPITIVPGSAISGVSFGGDEIVVTGDVNGLALNGFDQQAINANIRFGSGVPSFACGVPTLYLNTQAATVSTLLYICVSGSSWTAVSVP